MIKLKLAIGVSKCVHFGAVGSVVDYKSTVKKKYVKIEKGPLKVKFDVIRRVVVIGTLANPCKGTIIALVRRNQFRSKNLFILCFREIRQFILRHNVPFIYI